MPEGSSLLGTEESNHDIAVVLEKNPVQLPTGQAVWLRDLVEQLLLDLFVLPVNRALNLDISGFKNVFNSLVQRDAIGGQPQFNQNIATSLLFVVFEMLGEIVDFCRRSSFCGYHPEKLLRATDFSQNLEVVKRGIHLRIPRPLSDVPCADGL